MSMSMSVALLLLFLLLLPIDRLCFGGRGRSRNHFFNYKLKKKNENEMKTEMTTTRQDKTRQKLTIFSCIHTQFVNQFVKHCTTQRDNLATLRNKQKLLDLPDYRKRHFWVLNQILLLQSENLLEVFEL